MEVAYPSRRNIVVKVGLLFFVGDGPGIAEVVRNMGPTSKNGACLRCFVKGEYYAEYHCTYFGNMVYFLPLENQMRGKWDEWMGPNRTHGGNTCELRVREQVEDLMRKGAQFPSQRTTLGYNGLHALSPAEWFDPAVQYIVDAMHAFGNVIDDLLDYIGGDRKWANAVLQREVNVDQRPRITALLKDAWDRTGVKERTINNKKCVVTWTIVLTEAAKDMKATPPFCAPWRVCDPLHALMNRLSSIDRRTLPTGYHRALADPLRITRVKLNSAGLMTLVGPMLIYYICHLVPSGEIRTTMCALVLLLAKIKQPVIPRDKVPQNPHLHNESWYMQVLMHLVELETLLPANFFTINWHSLIHFAQHLFEFGPLRYVWMFLYERMGRFLKNNLHTGKSPVVGLMKAHCIAEQNFINKMKASVKPVLKADGNPFNPPRFDSPLLHRNEKMKFEFGSKCETVYFVTGKAVESLGPPAVLWTVAVLMHEDSVCCQTPTPVLSKEALDWCTLSAHDMRMLEEWCMSHHHIAVKTKEKVASLALALLDPTDDHLDQGAHHWFQNDRATMVLFVHSLGNAALPYSCKAVGLFVEACQAIESHARYPFIAAFDDDDMVVLQGISPFATFHKRASIGAIDYRTTFVDRLFSSFSNCGCKVQHDNIISYGNVTHFISYTPYPKLAAAADSETFMLMNVKLYESVEGHANMPLTRVYESEGDASSRWFSCIGELQYMNVVYWPWLDPDTPYDAIAPQYTDTHFAVIECQHDSFLKQYMAENTCDATANNEHSEVISQ